MRFVRLEVGVMAETHEEPPPKYSPAPENHAPISSTAVETAPPAITTGTVAITEIGDCEGRQNIVNHCTVESGGGQNTTGDRTMGKLNASHSFSGFIDILYKNKKLPWSCEKNFLYKAGLLAYFSANLVYSITAAAIQKEDLVYYLIYIIISLIGSLSALGVMILHIKKLCIKDNDTEEETELLNSMDVHRERVREYRRKAKRIVVDYVLLSMGEFLFYPVLTCTLYGFVNERAWRLDDTISNCNFAFLLYSVIMDILYMKAYVILLVARVARAAYAKYDDLLKPTEIEWKRYFTPVYLTIPFAVLTAITHWFTIGIIGVRIYVDNFTLDKDDRGSGIPDTGDYKVAPFTGYMIACSIYLPIISWITYIILNKLWFFEVYSAIYQMTNGADHMPPQHSWDKKLLAVYKDPLAYIAVLFLMLPFVAFTVGTYLVDYGSTDYEVSSSARHALQGIAPYFITLFVLSNLQAVIIFIVMIVAVVVVPVRHIALGCKIHTK